MKYKEYKTKVETYKASEKTAKAWCLQEKIPVQTLRTWLKRVKKRDEDGTQNKLQKKIYAEYRALVITCKTSGVTAKEWCTENGILLTTYGTWRKKVHLMESQKAIDTICDIKRGRKPEPKITPQTLLCEVRRW